MWNGHRLSRYKKCLSSLNEWQVKGVEYFLPCASAPLLFCISDPCPLLPSSTFSVSPFLLILASSVSLWLFFRFYLRSPRTLRRTITILYLDHKKARERFLI